MAKGCAPGSGATMGDKEYAARAKSKGKVNAPKTTKPNVGKMGKAIAGKKPR